MTQDKISKIAAAVGGIALLVLQLLVLLEVGNLGDIQEQGTATIFTDLQVGDGSASAPSFSFSGDTDNGLYRVGTNNVGLAAGGSVILDVDGTDINANSLPVVNIGNSGTDFDSSGGLTLASGLTVSDGNLVGADWFRMVAQTSITVTTHITPTGSYQPITTASWVTPTLAPASGFTNGFVLRLVNNSNVNINIADSGNIVLSAAALLGQYDTLTLLSDGTRWIELERSNN